MRVRDLLRLSLLAFPIVAALSGCDSAPVEPIRRSGPGPWVVFTYPESTLAIFFRSVTARNATNYGLCLADTLADQREFHAVFDSSDLTAFAQSGGTPPTEWTRGQELAFFPHFVAYLPNTKYDVYLSVDTGRGGIIDVGGATQKKIYNMHYRVWSGASPVCAGSAGITMGRMTNSGEYKITYWEDRRDTTGVRTWGMARLNGR